MSAGTWLIETAVRSMFGNDFEEEWTIRAGYGSEQLARADAKQVGPHWRRQNLRVRVRFEPAE